MKELASLALVISLSLAYLTNLFLVVKFRFYAQLIRRVFRYFKAATLVMILGSTKWWHYVLLVWLIAAHRVNSDSGIAMSEDLSRLATYRTVSSALPTLMILQATQLIWKVCVMMNATIIYACLRTPDYLHFIPYYVLFNLVLVTLSRNEYKASDLRAD